MRFEDLTGKQFGYWTVLNRAESKNKRTKWLCKCKCGTIKEVDAGSLKSGASTSCGCFNIQQTKKANKKYNTYDLTGEYGIGYTNNNYEFYFDLEDYDKIKYYCWFKKDGYLLAYDPDSKKRIRLHNLIMNFPTNAYVDHVNGIRNDCRKSELRLVNRQENNINKGFSKNNTSGVKGVCWSSYYNKWRAFITYNYKRINLGYYIEKTDAIKARKEAEEKYFKNYNRM